MARRRVKVYYAHPISIYNTKQEERDIEILEKMDFNVVNPNAPKHDEEYKKFGMTYFRRLVEKCGALAYRPFPDGSIPAGIAEEIDAAKRYCLPIIELPAEVHMHKRMLNVDETRSYLKEVGHR